jgi:hypothetical protein
MNLSFIEEPELEFGAGRHIDIRFGIMNYGPLDFESTLAPKQINLGIIGTRETVEGTREWFERCRTEIKAKQSRQPNLFPRFPGFSSQTGFQSTLVIDDKLCRDISKSDIAGLGKLPARKDRIVKCVEMFSEEIRYLSQNTPAKVIICALPLAMLQSMASEGEDMDHDVSEIRTDDCPDFHDMLKARAMQLYRKPIQLILPSTYDESQQRKQTRAGRRRTLQDEATRAWNIHSALYYKAEGTPWRVVREATALTVCYVGISFYRSLDRTNLLTSVAQVFNERGEGVVVQGGTASISKEDRQVHLSEEHAYGLLKRALKSYRDVHKTMPARIVIHKSSRFNENEMSGFGAVVTEERVETYDFLSISDSSARLYRGGEYPPLRGTLLTCDEEDMVLYTRGSVEFFETYPGKYLPVPLRIHCDSTEETHKFLAREILALTKMNWNHTQFDGSEPVTLRAARQCSSVLRYCLEGSPIEPRYSYYM